jgi:hypothetical protein
MRWITCFSLIPGAPQSALLRLHQLELQYVHGIAHAAGHGHPAHVPGHDLQALGERIQGVAVLGEEGAAFVGDGVELLAAGLGFNAGVAELFEHGEGGVDGAGAWAVLAIEHFFDGADELVAVARLFFDEGQEQQAEVAGAEHAATTEPAATAAAAHAFAVVKAEGAAAAEAAAAACGGEVVVESLVHLIAEMAFGVVPEVHGVLRYIVRSGRTIYRE